MCTLFCRSGFALSLDAQLDVLSADAKFDLHEVGVVLLLPLIARKLVVDVTAHLHICEIVRNMVCGVSSKMWCTSDSDGSAFMT